MKNFMSSFRYWSALILLVILGLMYWLMPQLSLPATPERAALVMMAIFLLAWGYLLVQGYPISHGNIGSSSSHNLDNIMSGLPAIGALFGVFMHIIGFWPLSFLNLCIAVIVLAVVFIDLVIYGGAASKINRLTDEIKTER